MSTVSVIVTTPFGFLEDSQPPNAIDVDNEEEISSTKALYCLLRPHQLVICVCVKVVVELEKI